VELVVEELEVVELLLVVVDVVEVEELVVVLDDEDDRTMNAPTSTITITTTAPAAAMGEIPRRVRMAFSRPVFHLRVGLV